MKNNKQRVLIFLFVVAAIFLARFAFAHCDTMEGPVVKDAKIALEKSDITPVLKWVKPDREAEVIIAFEKALSGRKTQDKEKSDMGFFETLIRIHREGEGAGFEGIKPAGSEVEPAIVEADKALEEGKADNLIKLVTDDAAAGIKQRFDNALEKKKHKDESVELGREFVEAYVEFTHYVERLHKDILGEVSHHGEHQEAEKEHKE
ncbi:MAG: DUF6448 family protein [Candidatus Omnitrophica bacterium]|nr:DUF6448 family protein [Candidatus Omnitrophota bacterium]HOX54489.1 DUF6448 family protein [Candidatus Omnitrophota bacterium]